MKSKVVIKKVRKSRRLYSNNSAKSTTSKSAKGTEAVRLAGKLAIKLLRPALKELEKY
jgi:hypothetical protein